MPYRGRLIKPFLAEMAQLDPAATELDPDAAGPLTSGYDDDFKEPVVFTAASTRTSARKEKAIVSIPAQVETGGGVDAPFEAMRQVLGGDSPDSRVVLVFHFKDLEQLGLVDPTTGEALVRKGDRLHAIRTMAGVLVQTIRTPPGLYVVQAAPAGFGIGLRRNLLLVTLEDREQGVQAPAT